MSGQNFWDIVSSAQVSTSLFLIAVSLTILVVRKVLR